MTYSAPPRILVFLAVPLFLCLGFGSALAKPAVAIANIDFEGEVSPGAQRVVQKSLGLGFSAAGMDVVEGRRVAQLLGAQSSPCTDSACWRMLAAKLTCGYLAGATVTGGDRSYEINLWIADGIVGKKIGEIDVDCEICGLKALAEKVELAASSLRAKLADQKNKAGQIMVESTPPAAAIYVDGDKIGETPKLLSLPAGKHEIQIRLGGYGAASRNVHIVAGAKERIDLKLLPLGGNEGTMRTAGWITLGAGLASVVAGIALFKVDGGGGACSPTGIQCPTVRETTAAAWTMTGIGIGAAVAGATMIYLYRTPARDNSTASAQLGLSGFGGVELRGAF